MNWDFLIKDKESISVSTDTRNLPAGCVFFALHGANFDGNKFAKQALEQGASLAVIDNPKYALPQGTMLVEDTLLALQDLARAWRRELGLPIIGITGTNGKTTTKELLATVLSTRYNLHYTQGNLNNQIGVPLTLLQVTRAHEMAIVEMGASHPGDIKELVDIAEPNCGLITNVGRAHLEGFGSFEGVQQTKKELYDYLRENQGFIFRNIDNLYLAQMAGDLQTVPYTTGTMPNGTNLVGSYNAENISAAICVGEYYGVPRERALEAIRKYVPTNNRSQNVKTANNQLIVDAYNANPTSMQAAINAFKGDTYILGAMRELGEYTHLEHQNVVNMLAERKADLVYLVGEEYRLTTSPYLIFDTVEQLHEYLSANPLTNRTILLKGSRSTKMEKLLDIL
jgi:UDP-N-acetylmuramoyl-tripeptide--D-alanyl-D-alanine ligase